MADLYVCPRCKSSADPCPCDLATVASRAAPFAPSVPSTCAIPQCKLCECGRYCAHTVPPDTAREHHCDDCCRLPPSVPREIAEALPDDLRSQGWAVAIHNDYRQDGESRTFWLFTHPSGKWLKGEGPSDADALAQVRAALRILDGADGKED